ncbi:MAG: hypothetical protein KBA64_12940 [Armatimonadetes bacterium]|jgi:hypothetical protein|nr:hypothetical protein [Armatimonadota bacterium]
MDSALSDGAVRAEHGRTPELDHAASLRLTAAVGLGLVLIPVTARWLAEIEWVRYSDNATTQALFPHAIAILVTLIALSAGVRRIAPALAFGRREVLVCYICVCVGSHLAGHDMLQILYSAIAYVVHQAKPENSYADLLHPCIPTWALPTEGPGLRSFHEGGSSLADPANWASWRVPMVTWGLFTVVLCAVMFAVSNLLRMQWENERLTYPIAQVPLWMSRDEGRVMLPAPFLIGVALGVLPTLVNTIKHFQPLFPGLNVGVQYHQVPDPPWVAAGSLPEAWHPFAFGLAYLVPTDLLFSCWFFYVFTSLLRVISYARGHQAWGGFPYVDQQATGAHLGLALIVLVNARRHLRFVAREAWRPTNATEREALSYRLSLGVLGVGTLMLLGWMVALGFSPLTAVAWLSIFGATVLAVTRLRAEYGLPTNELFQKGAEYVLVGSLGSRSFGRSDLVAMGLMNWLTRTHRQFPMQVQADMLEVARRGDVGVRRMGWLVLAATVVGILSAKWALLDVSMRTGIATAKVHGPALWAFGPEPWNKVVGWIDAPTAPEFGPTVAILYGAFFCMVLYRARLAWVWWPFHPGGFVMSCTFGLARLWLPLFLTWCFKAVLLRYGGHTAYRRCLPFFLGMIVGQYTSAVLRTLIDIGWQLYLPAESGIGGL